MKINLGLKRGVVELVEYEPEWKNAAGETIEQLWHIFGSVAKDIQHIGSTAIENIKAKPIIDIGVLIDDFSEAEALYSDLEKNGFSNRGGLLNRQSMVFSKGEDIPPDDRITTHYIHIVNSDDTDWRDYIAFRDYLNAHASIAKTYEALKIKLATKYPYDKGRLNYVDGKSAFITQTLHEALVSGSMRGKLITLVPCSNKMWHEYYSRYVPDPMMDTTPYIYDFVRGEKNFKIKMADITRKYFAILHERNVIGVVYLKHINTEEKSTNLGIALVDDSVKGKGFGTEALKLIINYTFNVMALNTIYAESVLRNSRSQHVMEKVGFIYTHEDDTFKYYKLDMDGML